MLFRSGYSRKDLGASLKNFRQSFSKSQAGESAYLFRCSDMVAGGPVEARKLVAHGRCQGEACPCWPWGPGRPETVSDTPGAVRRMADRSWKPAFPGPGNQAAASPSGGADEDPGERLTRRLWRALQLAHAEGQELRLSLVLAAADRLRFNATASGVPYRLTATVQSPVDNVIQTAVSAHATVTTVATPQAVPALTVPASFSALNVSGGV